ncbi:SURF1 family protein [Variovorax sp. dw_308]|uniref:SURF1 family protein n=1 Tax=Variovorax sp. dw_308 TaxID=2721546 RepID=UPI001C483CDD|nr:SURF1 family protein [Variovorax sp. dw_308]
MRGGARAAAAAVAVLLLAGFIALGTWQVERRAWKLDLIERVDQRVHAPAVAAPGPASWPEVSAARDEYRHVRVTGVFLHDREALVQAVTTLGSGFWVLTPLRQPDGRVVFVNRGFVPPEARQRATRNGSEPAGETTVTGLLRLTEPKGGFLRSNDAASGRWYSRDVQAMAAARGLAEVAPYFIDADATPSMGEREWPAGGLTVVTFQNNHLVYALTWYTLALMVVAAAWRFLRQGPEGRADPGSPSVGD